MSDKPKKAVKKGDKASKAEKAVLKNKGLLGKAGRALRDRESDIDKRLAAMEGAQTTDSNQ